MLALLDGWFRFVVLWAAEQTGSGKTHTMQGRKPGDVGGRAARLYLLTRLTLCACFPSRDARGPRRQLPRP